MCGKIKFDSNRDFTGRPLKVGDSVATTFFGSSSMALAKVSRFTNCKIGLIGADGNYCTKFPYQVTLVEVLF